MGTPKLEDGDLGLLLLVTGAIFTTRDSLGLKLPNGCLGHDA